MQRGQHTASNPVLEVIGMGDRNILLFGKTDDGAAKRMLRTALGTGSCFENRLLRDARCGVDFGDQRHSVSQGARLVEKYGIEMSQGFQINAPFDNGALARGASDRAEDGKWSACCDATRSSHNDNRYRRPNVVRDEKGEHR